MKIIGTALALGVLATGAALPALGSPGTENFGSQHAVFVMTNDADSNEVIAYERTEYGTLQSSRKYQTGGRGNVDDVARARRDQQRRNGGSSRVAGVVDAR